MGFAAVNIFGVESLSALWPFLLIHAGMALALAARWVLPQQRTNWLPVAGLLGLWTGCMIGHLSIEVPTPERAHCKSEVAEAAERVGRHKEALALFIDENLPDIPEVLHANCREFEQALSARGLLCVDVGPDAPLPEPANAGEARGFAMWQAYRAAKADLDRLLSER